MRPSCPPPRIPTVEPGPMEIPSDATAGLLSLGTFFCMLDRLTYWLALGAITVIRHLPLAVCFLLGQVLGAALWAILPRYRKLARENLSAAFADLTGAQLRSLTFRHFITLGANGVCAFKIAALPTETILRIASLENSEGITLPDGGWLLRKRFPMTRQIPNGSPRILMPCSS